MRGLPFWNRIYDHQAYFIVSNVHPAKEGVCLGLWADAAVVGTLTAGNFGVQERRGMASPSTRPLWN